jgi:AcrR family transcriptional regulator
MARKQQKTPETPKEKPVKDRIIDAALSLAAVQGWETCSIRDIAEEADISLEKFYDHFDEKSDVLIAYGRRIDRAVLEAFAELDYESKSRDRLFDILMERFDLVNQDRAAVLSILHSYKVDPKQALISCSPLGQSMSRMLEAAGLDTSGLRGAARVAGLTALFMCVLRVWMKDNSADMSETMAALDKGLSRMESAANSLGL